ncbi:uncharacterized protein LOC127858091 isoform X2 [Dreissena polymorpha]|uniref:uncharacterized protein LOC127858091 isoform X1 n=2 Tax=Dreissena polymorpha TaxID=45954 RepID=UPI002264092B|nr:uncharacterized protein LOC127858091 isoform X1 [Dreissena polymorpha]XP_052250946.1 uncharacterized protein LOC127858091 isoform X2 [Dreissena polymorpha]
MKVCNIQKEKELLQEELTRKKEEVRQLHQYKKVMEKRHGILTATIQMLKQDSPKTNDNNDSLKKLIEEEAKLKIESDIMNDQLQKLATVTDPLSETVNEASMETTEEKTRVLFANNSISDKYESCDNVRVVAAIHIGSQFTELAFSMTSNPTRIKTLNWNGGISKKEKTTVLIKEDGKTFEAFGDEAEQIYSNLVFKNKKERYMFRDFMQQLYRKKSIGTNTKLKDADEKTLNALQVVSTTIRQIQSKFMTRLKAQIHDGRFDEKDMYWVLTFPPGHDSAETFMTMAAVQAGIDRSHVSVVMDKEAIVCFFPQLDFLMEENRISTVATGTRHIVCDARAEKVGIAVIEVSSVYKINLIQAEFISRGEMINEAFANILDSFAGFEIMKLLKDIYLNDFNEINKNIEIIKKETKLPKRIFYTFKLPALFSIKVQERCGRSLKEQIRNSEYKTEVFGDGNKLLIRKSIFKNIFNEKPLQKIIERLSIVSSRMGCSSIFTVGEFSETPYFQKALLKAFPKMRITCARGKNAILTGADLFGHFVCDD